MADKRLIDANALKLNAWPERYTGEGIVYVEDIDNAPTVSAVEVVRCKDCKHFIQEEHGCNHFGYYSHTPWVDEVDFCSCGERREGE